MIKQIDISYFLTVLLSIPFYKLPCSRPEKKNFFKSAVSVNNSVIDTAALECLSLLFAASWQHSRAVGAGGARVPWYSQILADKSTLFQPGRAAYANHITT